jgi:hypothetical protein
MTFRHIQAPGYRTTWCSVRDADGARTDVFAGQDACLQFAQAQAFEALLNQVRAGDGREG